MKFRLSALAALLVAVVLLMSAADAQSLYVRNRPFPNRVNLGGTMYVPVEEFLQALKMDWVVRADGTVEVSPGTGSGVTVTTPSFALTHGGRSIRIEGALRDTQVWVPLRPVAEFLKFTVAYSPDIDVLDVVAGRLTTEEDRELASRIKSENQAREQAVQDAWNKRKSQIEAERKAREEEARKAAEAEKAEKAEKAGEAGDSEDVEGTFPDEMAGQPAKAKARSKTKARPTASPSPSPTPEASPSPSPAPVPAPSPAPAASPKPAPEALLIVISPVAQADYFTGRVTCRARVQNNGEAPATGISARVTLKGPDGSVWNRQTVRRASLQVDDSWNVETTYTHPSKTSMPRGTPTVTVELDYTRK